MPGPDGVLTVACDFDGSLVEPHSKPLVWRGRAKDFILACAAAGIRLWLHSCRCQVAVALEMELPGDAEGFWRYGRVPEDVEYSWGLYEEMRAFLEAEGVWGLLTPWTSPGKPIADLYADDLAERPDWLALAGELGLALQHAQQGGDRPVVTQGVAPPGDGAAGLGSIPAEPAGGPAAGAPGPGVVVAPVGDVRPSPGPGG